MNKFQIKINGVTDSDDKYFLLISFLLILIAGFNLFYCLGDLPINDWDEARHGVSAFEMNGNGNFTYTTFQGATDYWNLKPPLGIWLIAGSFRLFGNNPFALRFPSALAALFSIIFTIYIAKRLYNSLVAILSGCVMATSFWFLFIHSGRTGDFDAQMTLLVILAVVFLIKMDDKRGYFYWSAFIIGLAFLLKSFAILQILIILVCYLYFSKKYRMFKLHHYLYFVLVLMIPILIWGVLRYSYDGMKFFQSMFSYDLFKRSTTGLEGHNENILYYVYFIIWGLFPWSIFTWWIPFYRKKYDKKEYLLRNETLLMIWILVPLLLFSIAQTKCFWYIYPAYPPTAILIGLLLAEFFKSNYAFQRKRTVLIVFLIFILLTEARNIVFIESEKNRNRQIPVIVVNKDKSLSQSEIFRIEVLKEKVINQPATQ